MNTIKANRNSRHQEPLDVFTSDSLKTEFHTPQIIDPKPASLKEKVKKKIHPKPITQNEYQDIYDELRELDPDETIIWIGKSSQLIHLTAYFFCFLFCWLLFPLLIAYYIYLQTKNTTYVITDQRLRIYSGIFVKRIDDVELYRIKDTTFIQPFILGRFGLSNIQLITSDVSWPNEYIPGITNGRFLREKIRKIVEVAREKKGVREVDYYTHTGTMPNGL
ncbi:MAG TPA: PH domain-containing protein [Candidatus Acidoferrales bacterium]|nr:PH domain-containing protein [Candidatus Acidoferrales bacterium]